MLRSHLRQRSVRWPMVGLVLTVMLVLAPVAAAQPRIILDTDYESDVDDVGALAMLHALADNGEAQILATIVSGLHGWSAPAVDVVNTYYGRGAIPIANVKGSGVNIGSRYAQHLAENFPRTHDFASGAQAPDAVALYREVLAAQPDKSVTVVTVGYATNLRNLLASGPDEHSSLSGAELVAQKVDVWVNMGGNFEQRSTADGFPYSQNSTNNNWTHDTGAAVAAIRAWPADIVFNGREIGHSMRAGAELADTAADNPVRVAYEQFFGGTPRDHHLADQSALLYAVRGLGYGDQAYWELEHGQITVNDNASFTWEVGAAGEHVQARMVDALSPDATRTDLLDPSQIQEVIEDLMAQAPRGADLTGPAAAKDLTGVASEELAGRMHLSWSPASETDLGSWVAGYRVYRNGEVVGQTFGTSFVDLLPTRGEHTYAVRAFNASGTLGDAVEQTVTAPTSAGNGEGLMAEFFNNKALSGDPVVTRTDGGIDFDWLGGSPDPAVASDGFSARWSGFVEAAHAEGERTYTFTTSSNDGVRLWINGELIIDDWANGPLRTNTGTVELEAGERYAIVLEFYENTNSARISLQWEAQGLPREVVPTARLYAVPEPGSLGLLLPCGVWAVSRRRRI